MLNNFRIIPFIIGIISGFVIFSFYKPEKRIIRQYPHPSSNENKTFRDANGACYKYSTHQVDCDANEATLRDYPIQG